MYNNIFKVSFLLLTLLPILLVRCRAWDMKMHPDDKASSYLCLVPPLLLSLVIPSQWTLSEVFWTFSIYLEALALLPQVGDTYRALCACVYVCVCCLTCTCVCFRARGAVLLICTCPMIALAVPEHWRRPRLCCFLYICSGILQIPVCV